MAGTAQPRALRETAPPFDEDALRTYLGENSDAVRRVEGYAEIADALERLADQTEQHYTDLEALEQRLTVLEEKMVAIARTRQSEEDLLAARREMDRQLRPYRGKMTADQLSMLEKQYLERALLQKAGLPRLSLFYMQP
jgi:hypothetical protein